MPENASNRREGKVTRQLIIAFDVGTTFSGISYCFVEPGQEPKNYSITRFPGQEHASGTTKIPSVLIYDENGTLRAAGAETMLPEVIEEMEDRGWRKVEWFKLRLCPKSMPSKLKTSTLPLLPTGKSVLDVYADFLSYLMGCAKKFIKDTHITIAQSWHSLRKATQFIIAHPNGWEGPQQARLRQAATQGGLIPDTPEGRSRVTFVTEGEASLNYCINGKLIQTDKKQGFIVADLGGGTLDFSVYKVVRRAPLRVGEAAASKCELEGSTFVRLRAKGYLQNKLRNSGSVYGTDEHVEHITTQFDETTKRTFRNASDVCFVRFGSPSDQDSANNIRGGKLKLSGEEVAAFFEPPIAATVTAINAYLSECPGGLISTIYLVGGFCASPYLVEQLKKRLGRSGIAVVVADGHSAKAVADGAISFYLNHYVQSRVAKMAYGVYGRRSYDPNDPEHVQLSRDRLYINGNGIKKLRGAFHVVVENGTVVSEETEFRRALRSGTSKGGVRKINLRLMTYQGSGNAPRWVTDDIKRLCRISADIPASEPVSARGVSGKSTRACIFEVVMWFGGPELKAQCCWMENGVEKRSPAKVIYEEFSDAGDGTDDELEVEEMAVLDTFPRLSLT